ncbi:MAG: uroporphyrinogen decarboxylase family protein [Kiritimatiellae bacterium]|nr:uroporphyrinogen decarboxylase family protein [Kiritimatiellia bacterium]
MFKTPSNKAKAAVWQAYNERKTVRVPMRWSANSRIYLLNPELNREGYTYRGYFNDPLETITIQAHFEEYVATVLNHYCDSPVGLPDAWTFRVDSLNTYDGSYFGSDVLFEDGQCPCAMPAYSIGELDAFLERDFSHPFDNPWIKERLEFQARVVKAAESFEYLGRKGSVAPFCVGFDGPVTVAAILFGTDIFCLMGEEPRKAMRLFETLTCAAVQRKKTLESLFVGGWKKTAFGGLADDSIQMISTEMYEELVLPSHELWYSETSDTQPGDFKRVMHLCGDATRHFKLIHDKLGVSSFDTGFPVDHGALRRTLGPDVEISGGPHVGLLTHGSSTDCATKTREILRSGIMQGGRYILQDGNNLPPCVPLCNLEAVYATCLEYGKYGSGE